MKYDNENIFAKILKDEISCDKVFEDENVLSFKDINPQAKLHILIIPKKKIIIKLELRDKGFQIKAHKGKDGGQEVFHFHLHLLSNS